VALKEVKLQSLDKSRLSPEMIRYLQLKKKVGLGKELARLNNTANKLLKLKFFASLVLCFNSTKKPAPKIQLSKALAVNKNSGKEISHDKRNQT
jgi:hypothetical protein